MGKTTKKIIYSIIAFGMVLGIDIYGMVLANDIATTHNLGKSAEEYLSLLICIASLACLKPICDYAMVLVEVLDYAIDDLKSLRKRK